MTTIDITGIPKEALKRALWENSKVASFFRMNSEIPPEYNKNQAIEAVNNKKGIDYFCGRVIKTNLSLDNVSPWGYDRDNGAGAFQRIVDDVKKKNYN
jgi:hypothetical protein